MLSLLLYSSESHQPNSTWHQLSWIKAIPKGPSLSHSSSHRHAHIPTLLAHGAGHNGSSQAAPLGTGGEAGLRKAGDRGGRDVESWKGALAFSSQNTLVPLQHHPQPSAPSGLQISLLALLHLSQEVWQPPGGFCHRYKWVGWGRAGRET